MRAKKAAARRVRARQAPTREEVQKLPRAFASGVIRSGVGSAVEPSTRRESAHGRAEWASCKRKERRKLVKKKVKHRRSLG